MEKETILCGASSYEEKFYLNPDFSGLPESIKEELQILCVLFTADIGGILMLSFNDEGELELQTSHEEDDLLYDEIGSVLKVKELQKTKRELFESLEKYYEFFVQGGEK